MTTNTAQPDKHDERLRETMTNYLIEAVTESVDHYFKHRELFLKMDRFLAVSTLQGVMNEKLGDKWADISEYMAACLARKTCPNPGKAL